MWCILESFSGLEVGLWIKNSKSWKARSFEYLCIEENSAFGWHFTRKINRRVERVSEVNKTWNLLHWNVHKENVIDKLNVFQTKGFNGLAASIRFSMSAKKTTEKATAIFISHAVSLYEVFFFKLRPRLNGEKLSRGEGSPAYPSYHGRANFSYISLQNLANNLYEKQKVGSARRVTRLAGSPFCDGRVTLLAGPTFLHINTLARSAGTTPRKLSVFCGLNCYQIS